MLTDSGSRIPGYYRLTVAERRSLLCDRASLASEELALLDNGGLTVDHADGMIENVVGTLALPCGIALNFKINGRDYLVPMAIEEPSVVAAASYAARMARDGGGFFAEADPPLMIAQVQMSDVPDPALARLRILAHREEILALAQQATPRLVERGGGARDIEVRIIPSPHRAGVDARAMLVVHVLVDCRDAMGANLLNAVAEKAAGYIASLAGEHVRIGLRILSNLADRRLVRVRAEIPQQTLAAAASAGSAPCDAQTLGRAIESASQFASLDPYRAATHNKGIMNGVDAVLLATGNDWRSVEAGAHAYAARHGSYAPLATWRTAHGRLVGQLEMPLAVGIVGGALHAHAGARLSLRILDVRSAAELACVAGAAGLATNLAALRALASEGIQRGHMSLHARAVARGAGASGEMLERVAAEMAALGDIGPARARQVLRRRAGNAE
ncbi:MAG: hydroxymethylglutaryl-CoA reductase, degradative [Pseudomonadota bacterium]